MNYQVHNWGMHVGNVDITGITASSVFLIGDNEVIKLNSYYDTPPDAYIVGSLVPLRAPSAEGGTANEKTNGAHQ